MKISRENAFSSPQNIAPSALGMNPPPSIFNPATVLLSLLRMSSSIFLEILTLVSQLLGLVLGEMLISFK